MKKIPVKNIVIICIFLGLTALWWFGSLDFLENAAADTLYQQMKEDMVGTEIVIVGIDEATLEAIGRWPYPRAQQAEVLSIIASGDPAAIGVDILYTEPSTDEDDGVLEAVLKENDNIVLPVFGRFADSTVNGQLVVDSLGVPLDRLAKQAHLAHINVFPDTRDGVVRKGLDTYAVEGQPVMSFSRVLYDLYANYHGMTSLPKLPTDKFSRFPIDFAGEPESFEMVSYGDVAQGNVPPEYFEGKIVLIGPYATGMVDDYYYTPMNKQVKMFGVEIHANILQMYMDNRMKTQSAPTMDFAILAVMALAAVFGIRRFTMTVAAIYSAVLSGGWVFIAHTLYDNGFALQVVYPVIMVAGLFLGDAVFKYIAEYRERKRITGLFGRYVSPDVVKEIIKEGQEGIQLGGTRKELSVIFVDIRGFTPLSESMEPEQIVSILNDYLNLTATSIFKYGGTVDKFIGDATMAIFNAPIPLENHPLMAAKAAWAMKEGADALEATLLERFGKTVKFGIGVHFGDAVVGNIGATFRMDYTAIGDTVNTAARLESNAKPGDILISQAFYDQVKDNVLVEDRGPLKVKGKAEPIQVYALQGIKEEI